MPMNYYASKMEQYYLEKNIPFKILLILIMLLDILLYSVFFFKKDFIYFEGREVGSAGVRWRNGEKRHTTVIE